MASNLRVDTILPSTGTSLGIGTANGSITVNGSVNSLNVSGNLGVGGVLTYEDVTNVDSVGVITARGGINLTGGVINSAGNINCTSGRFQRGSATVQDGDAIAGGININGTDMDASVIMSVFGNDGDFTRISGSKSRNASVGSHTVVNDGDTLLSLKGFGSDGTDFEEAAQIEMQVDGSPGNNDMPGRIVFKTTADGATSPTERMRISSQGYVTKPAHPAFRVGRSTDVNPGNSGTLVFNYVSSPTHFNQGGHYNNSTGAFTAPVAGIYNFYAQVLWEGVSSGQNMADAFTLYYNASGGASGGTLVSYDARRAEYIENETGNGGYYGAFTTLLFYMAANSSMYVRNSRSLTVHGNANFTFFQGYLVG